MASATALTLIATPAEAMWSPTFTGTSDQLGCLGLRGSISPFCFVRRSWLATVHVIAILVLLLVASGWRPRITGLLHWWISFGVMGSAAHDGGDQVAAIFTLLLIPWTLTDGRKWHWSPSSRVPVSRNAFFIAHTVRFLVRLQVMVVYLYSSATKLAVAEWRLGTAFYFWAHDDVAGLPAWLLNPLDPVLRLRPMTALATWGTVVLELALVAGFALPKRFWGPLLWIGVFFHVAIAVGIGIPSFSLTMIGVLIVYLRPVEAEFRLRLPSRRLRR